MAKKRSTTRVRSTAADRVQGGSGRGRKRSGRGANQARGSGSSQGRGEQMVGRGGQEQEGGVWSGARDIAQNVGQSARGMARGVGETTRDAAQATFDTARGWAAGAADAAGSVAGKVRENPWPSLLIGAGATWIAIDALRGRTNEQVRDRASDRARGSRGGRRSSERGAVGQAVAKVAQAGRSAGEQIEEFVRDRPLLAGAATLGLGMAVGMALPSSIAENEVLGQARDTVVRRAKGAARETMEKVRDVTDTIEKMGPFGSRQR